MWASLIDFAVVAVLMSMTALTKMLWLVAEASSTAARASLAVREVYMSGLTGSS